MAEEVVREVSRKRRPLDEWKDRNPDPAKALVDALDKQELKKVIDTPTHQVQEEEGSFYVVDLAKDAEAKVIVEDLATRFNIPPGFILAFKDRKTSKVTPYYTDLFYGALMERKGYARLEVEKTGPKHDPQNHRYHYIAELTPVIPEAALKALRLLKDVNPSEFLAEYRRLTAPIREDGFASPETVRMKTMRTDYNLDRMAKRRAHRHMGMLYSGIGGGAPKEIEQAGEEAELGPPTIDAKAEDVPQGYRRPEEREVPP